MIIVDSNYLIPDAQKNENAMILCLFVMIVMVTIRLLNCALVTSP